jgi:hypothetical protein
MARYIVGLAACALLLGLGSLCGGGPPGSRLDQVDLRQARGGDPQTARCDEFCDVLSNQLIPCVGPGLQCRLCVNPNDTSVRSTADRTGAPGDDGCDPAGNKKQGTGVQTCGRVWRGQCVRDAQNNWRCAGGLQGFNCNTTFDVGSQ